MRLNLKIAIVEVGESQRAIATRCGIAEARFSSIIRGWISPRETEREAIAAALGRPAAGLFDESQADEQRHAQETGA